MLYHVTTNSLAQLFPLFQKRVGLLGTIRGRLTLSRHVALCLWHYDGVKKNSRQAVHALILNPYTVYLLMFDDNGRIIVK